MKYSDAKLDTLNCFREDIGEIIRFISLPRVVHFENFIVVVVVAVVVVTILGVACQTAVDHVVGQKLAGGF